MSGTPFQLHLLNVGQGEAIVIDLPDGSFATIDAGPKKPLLSSVSAMIDERLRSGRQFRFAAYTHWDMDHIGGMRDLLQRYRPIEIIRPAVDWVQIRQLAAAMSDRALSPALRGLELLEIQMERAGVAVTPLGSRQRIDGLGDVEIRALTPTPTSREELLCALGDARDTEYLRRRLDGLRNAVSLVLWIRVFGRSLLLPGEVDARLAQELEANFRPSVPFIPHDPRAIWVKLSHHGSRHGTSEELFRIFAQPNFVASASHGGRYGHPHPVALSSILARGGHAMCTRLGRGCQMIMSDPTQFSARDPKWAEGHDLSAVPGEICYGDITITVAASGAVTISGSARARLNCPYMGPKDGRIVISPLVAKKVAKKKTAKKVAKKKTAKKVAKKGKKTVPKYIAKQTGPEITAQNKKVKSTSSSKG